MPALHLRATTLLVFLTSFTILAGQTQPKTHLTLLNSDWKTIPDAKVKCRSAEGKQIPMPFAPDYQQYIAPVKPTGPLQIKVKHRKYKNEVFEFPEGKDVRPYLHLARKGEAYFIDYGQKVYYQPEPSKVGLTLERSVRKRNKQAWAEFEALMESLNLEFVQKIYPDPGNTPNYRPKGTIIYEYQTKDGKPIPASNSQILRTLRNSPLITCAGPKCGKRRLLRNNIYFEGDKEARDWLEANGIPFTSIQSTSTYIIEFDTGIGTDLLKTVEKMHHSKLFKSIAAQMCSILVYH